MSDVQNSSHSDVKRVSSGGPWEESFGYSRAVAAGDHVHVSGTTAMVDGAVVGESDPFLQTTTAFNTALASLEAFGLTVEDVVRTRMYITHSRDSDEVGRAHGEIFRTVRPASSMVVVAGLIDSRMIIEVEVDAYRGSKR